MPRIQRHECDVAHLHVVLARKRSEVGNLVFVMAAHDNGIDLYRLEPSLLRGIDSGEHFIQHVHARHTLEDISFQTVETKRDAIESGRSEEHTSELPSHRYIS